MPHEMNVGLPGESVRILRSTDQEALVRPASGRIDEETLQSILTIRRIGAEVGKIGDVMLDDLHRAVHIRVHMTVKGSNASCPELGLQLSKSLASRVTQDHLQIAKTTRAEAAERLACSQTREGHRSVEIVDNAGDA